MRSVEDHLGACLAAIAPLPPATLPILSAIGRVLAEDITSPIQIPSFDNSSMDGYAVMVADVAGADGVEVWLPVVGDVPAGSAQQLVLHPGEAIRIMTGAPLPAGAEAVVPVEWTDAGTDRVLIRRAPRAGQNLRHAGDDVQAGEAVLRAGARLSSRQVALLAAVGRDRVLARPRPRVLVLPSGSELVPPGKSLGPGQIHDSNGYGLVAAAVRADALAEHGGIIPDDADSVRSMLADAARRADLVITSGGVSAGAYDTVKEVLAASGTMEFTKVAMQPGMPQGFGTLAGTPVFTLPGNPVSALVSFEVFVLPALQRLAGEVFSWPTVTARAAVGWRSPPGKRQYARAVLADGLVTPVGGQGSHLLADLAEATCLAVVGEGVQEVAPGDEVECRMLS